ncbi:PR domain zinc finger protein 12 [Porphyridium purpureum]|uniref:PR domain zinc finger protein 12 n=1 Tax=Porphyridium purpureum TaxID=35688 RepID=A0A5J4Z5J7_PORPP|nr:PR domain zinc finger protein 12 [Porphyridium purpureum]|eukprot:POR4623..scf295_1
MVHVRDGADMPLVSPRTSPPPGAPVATMPRLPPPQTLSAPPSTSHCLSASPSSRWAHQPPTQHPSVLHRAMPDSEEVMYSRFQPWHQHDGYAGSIWYEQAAHSAPRYRAPPHAMEPLYPPPVNRPYYPANGRPGDQPYGPRWYGNQWEPHPMYGGLPVSHASPSEQYDPRFYGPPMHGPFLRPYGNRPAPVPHRERTYRPGEMLAPGVHYESDRWSPYEWYGYHQQWQVHPQSHAADTRLDAPPFETMGGSTQRSTGTDPYSYPANPSAHAREPPTQHVALAQNGWANASESAAKARMIKTQAEAVKGLNGACDATSDGRTESTGREDIHLAGSSSAPSYKLNDEMARAEPVLFNEGRDYRRIDAKTPGAGVGMNFECLHCPRQFRQKSHCREHVYGVHKLVKPHACPHCPSRFSYGGNLRQHIEQKHKRERPIKCSQCHKGFKVIARLRAHVKRMHPDLDGEHVCAPPGAGAVDAVERPPTHPGVAEPPQAQAPLASQAFAALGSERRVV